MIKVNDLESPLLMRYADALGWSGHTEINILADVINNKIQISAKQEGCVLCGSFWGVQYPLYGLLVCEQCLGKLQGMQRLRSERLKLSEGEQP